MENSPYRKRARSTNIVKNSIRPYAPRHRIGAALSFLSLCALFLLSCFALRSLLTHEEPRPDADESSSPAMSSFSREMAVVTPDITIHEGNLILVNPRHRFQADISKSLVSLYENKLDHYQVKDREVLSHGDIIEPLNRMLADFYQIQGGHDLLIASCYRDPDRQTELYDDEIEALGSYASFWVAKPGYSEHHTGLALDMSIYHKDTGLSDEYDGEGIYRWINDNAHRYGFIVRYPSDKVDITQTEYEPWHFRYVGLPHSEIMKQQDLCLEQYIEYLRRFTPDTSTLNYTAGDGKTYSIYYVARRDAISGIPVPEDGSYEISGNNVDGYIVTVCH